ncbi:MAG: sigma-70 family RNA polymerase sigma factor [Solirubrobacterales bacterium]|nr:sigma-70 family RNA polymerase sigma factor [Solirubrobacterales bacterium]
MEASTLTHAERRGGIFSRPTPLLKLQGDEKLVEMTREGHQAAFEALVARYQVRLLGFCRQMLGSTEDAEDVLQEVFVAAYRAMVADDRPIAVKPWLYRIARNRSLNHLRKPTADGVDDMDMHVYENGTSTHDTVQTREEFRSLLADVGKLPETQRSALLLREIDAMSYEEIAQAMDTTVPAVKSLLVRARIALAESTQARQLTCGEVQVELAEAAEGLAKASGPVRRHVRSCQSCKDFRGQLRSDAKVLAALFPVGPILAFKGFIFAKLGAAGSAGAAGSGSGAAGAGAATAAGGTAASSAAIGGAAAAGGASSAIGGAVGAAIGSKAVAGLATVALLTAGAVEVKHVTSADNHAGTHNANVSKAIAAPATAVPLVPPATEESPVVKPDAQPVEEVVVEPTPTDGSADPKHAKKDPVAGADGSQASSGSGATSGGIATVTPPPVPCEDDLSASTGATGSCTGSTTTVILVPTS